MQSTVNSSNPIEEACKSQNFHVYRHPQTSSASQLANSNNPNHSQNPNSATSPSPSRPIELQPQQQKQLQQQHQNGRKTNGHTHFQHEISQQQPKSSFNPESRSSGGSKIQSTPPRSSLPAITDRKRFCRPTIVWYRGHDLRTDDHPALLAASQRGGPVVPVFVWDPSATDEVEYGTVKTWWLRKSLSCLDTILNTLGSKLYTLRGNRTEQIIELLQSTGADAVFWNRCYEPDIIAHDEKLRSTLREHGYLAESFKAELLVEPWELSASDVSPRFDTFNSYMRAWMRLPPPPDPTPSPSRLKPLTMNVESVGIHNIGLNTSSDTENFLSKRWSPGSRFAEKQLLKFLNELLPNFCESRHRRHMNGSSRLSPHLRFGEISPRRVYSITKKYVALWKKEGGVPYYEKVDNYGPTATIPKESYNCSSYLEGKELAVTAGLSNVKSVRREGSIQMEVHPGAVVQDNANELHASKIARFPVKRNNTSTGLAEVDYDSASTTTTTRLKRNNKFSKVPKPRIALSARMFLKNLCLRDFAHHVLYHVPSFNSDPLLPEFSSYPWASDHGSFERWREGMTGYPFLDAGMRELKSTGWVHNGMRFLLAAFLTKHLLLPWAKGLKEFYTLLVDGDFSSNALGWQWTAGSNTDSFPLRMLVNPVRIGYLQDPTGAYIRKWVPELRQLPNEFIHEPWKASPEVLQSTGITLGQMYPGRVIVMSAAKKRMQNSIWHMKKIFANSNIPRLMLLNRQRSDVKEVPDDQADLLNLDDPVPISNKHSLLPSLWSLVRCDSSAAYICERSPSPEPIISLDSANLDDSALEISLETGSIEQAILSTNHDHENDVEDGVIYRFSSTDRSGPRLSGRGDGDPMVFSLLDSRSLDPDENETERRGGSNIGNPSSSTDPIKFGRNASDTNFLDDAYNENAVVGLNEPDGEIAQIDTRNPRNPSNPSAVQQSRPSACAPGNQPSSKRLRRTSPSPDPHVVSASAHQPFHGSATHDAVMESIPPSFRQSAFPSQLAPNPSGMPFPLDQHTNHSNVANGTTFNHLTQQPFLAVQNLDGGRGNNNLGMVNIGTEGINRVMAATSLPTSTNLHHESHAPTDLPAVSTSIVTDRSAVAATARPGHLGGAPAVCGDSASLYAQQMSMIPFYNVPPVLPMMGPHGSTTDRSDIFGATPTTGVPQPKFPNAHQMPSFMPMGYGLYGTGMLDNSMLTGAFGMNGVPYPSTTGNSGSAGVMPSTTTTGLNSAVEHRSTAVAGTSIQVGTQGNHVATSNGFTPGSAPLVHNTGPVPPHIRNPPGLNATPNTNIVPTSIPISNPSPCMDPVTAVSHSPAPAHGHAHLPSSVVAPALPINTMASPPSVAANNVQFPNRTAPSASPQITPTPAPTPTPILVPSHPAANVRFIPASNSNPAASLVHEQHQRQQQEYMSSSALFQPTTPNSIVPTISTPSGAALPRPNKHTEVNRIGSASINHTPKPGRSQTRSSSALINQNFGDGLGQKGSGRLGRGDHDTIMGKKGSTSSPTRARKEKTMKRTRATSQVRQQHTFDSDISKDQAGEILGSVGAAGWQDDRQEKALYSERGNGEIGQNIDEITDNPSTSRAPNVVQRDIAHEYEAECDVLLDNNDRELASDSSCMSRDDAIPAQGATNAIANGSCDNDSMDNISNGLRHTSSTGGGRSDYGNNKRKEGKKSRATKRPKNRKQIEVNGSMIKKNKVSDSRDEQRSKSIDPKRRKGRSRANSTVINGKVHSHAQEVNGNPKNSKTMNGTGASSSRGRGKTKLKMKENVVAGTGSAGNNKSGDSDLGEEPTCLKDRENRLSAILARPGHEYHEFAKYITDKYVLTDKTDRQNSKDYVRLCNLKDDYHRQCEDHQKKLKIYRIKSFFSNILKLEVTGEWDRHNHGGVRGPYVYGIRLRAPTSS